MTGIRRTVAPLEQRARTSKPGAATSPALAIWPETPTSDRRHESTTYIGSGDTCWRSAAPRLLRWGVKTASGFRVEGGPEPVAEGGRHWLVVQVRPVRVREPVEVVTVVESGDRVGFAYGTLAGHPVSGEEAFILHRDATGSIWLTLRSLTRPAPELRWRTVFPVLLLAQRNYRRRYQRALLGPGSGHHGDLATHDTPTRHRK